jgi:hypothetical protein
LPIDLNYLSGAEERHFPPEISRISGTVEKKKAPPERKYKESHV